MKRQIGVLAAAAAMATTLAAAPATAGGAAHYPWNDGVGAYGGPAAAVVNNAGATVWWQTPGTTVQYKDVYKLKAFGGSSAYPVAQLGQPVQRLLKAAFPTATTIYYTRVLVTSAPSFPQGTRITS